jgi:transcriptional regulator with GAF, ATPase, and Fis domain
MDLYYRLNVFPILLPPLREREADIPALALHFVEQCSKRLGKPVPMLAPDVLADLQGHDWPGNIRELEHTIERAVLLNRGDVIHTIVLPGAFAKEESPKTSLTSMEEVERGHIIQVLRQCKGKIAGKGGAAEFLKMHASTLNSRIKKLGIQKLKDIF